ncbi:hypothetical protein GGR91_000147 [Sphingorhabdus rigui]|uniref:Uncharacterized protein n=1 Tax=Sphingorhabdus rigui TaxID=1282858 RepID=A0A840B0S7_9SPHN|nr:hypothetical protein [Sphingorhabdus rigui]MBB3941925.1 hypothetical protein [Sphingorhabdus rigui]
MDIILRPSDLCEGRRIKLVRNRPNCERVGAESFAKSWDAAINLGRQRQFDLAMERAIHGITTVRVLRGGSVTVNGGPDMRILRSALRSEDERWSRDTRESSPSTCDGEVDRPGRTPFP